MNPAPTSGEQAVAQTKWIALQPFVAKPITALTTVVLARLLSPEDFGLLALANTVLITVSLFQDLGLGRTLIAEPGEVRPYLSGVFWAATGMGLASYAVLALVAGPVAAWFDEPRLASILLAQGLMVVIQTLALVPHALLVRASRFRGLFLIQLAQMIAYPLVAIVLALLSFGYWAIVWGQVAAQLVRFVLVWASSRYRPGSPFGGTAVLPLALLRFSGGLTLAGILGWAGEAWILFSISKRYGSEALGFYNVAFEASRFPYSPLGALASSIVLTTYGALQATPEEMRRLIFKGLRLVNTLAFPVAAALAALAPWVVPVLLGAQWLKAVPLLAVLALLGFPIPSGNVFYPLLLSFGRARTVVLLTGVRLLACVSLFTPVLGFGLVAGAVAHVALTAATLLGFGVVSAKLIEVPVRDLGRAFLPPLLRALLAGLAAALAARAVPASLPPVVPLLAGGITAGLLALGLLRILDPETLRETRSVLERATGLASLKRVLAGQRQGSSPDASP